MDSCENCKCLWTHGIESRPFMGFSWTRSIKGVLHGVMKHRYLLSIVIYLSVCVVTVKGQASPPLEYNIFEEKSAGEFVGNVKIDGIGNSLGQSDLNKLQFRFRHDNMIPYNMFSIDERMGIIVTRQKIDREEVCTYQTQCNLELDITVRPIEFFRIIKVIVHVLDINDHKPTFPQSQLSRSVSETTMPGATFPIPSAEDADMGLFGIQKYELQASSPRNPFQLKVTNHSDGSMDVSMKLVDRLDREVDKFYKLIITALDGGSPPQTGSIVIDIIVTDANDNNPRFDNVSYHATVEENLPINSIIMTVHATDPDEGQNGEIIYSFSSHTVQDYGRVFGINNQTGEIYVKGPIDYEQESIYQLTVTAADRGPNSLPAFTKVTVEVLDVNDHSPEININTLTNYAYAQVLENAEVGTFVAHISVVDADSGESGQFSCEIDNSLFELSKLYGTEYQLKSATVFDRETKEEYKVQMTCHDRGQPPQSSARDILIRVKDENDHSPVFPKDAYLVNLNENNTVDQLIETIKVTDEDIDRNKAIRYELRALRDKDANTLRIDPITGEILANIVFDFEKQERYNYIIVASDHGTPARSASAFFNLTIIDINDEPPIFDEATYSFSVLEGQTPNIEIGEVHATDADTSKAFNDIVYYINSDMSTSDSFEVATKTGKLFSTKTLDREEKPVHYITIVASNEGYPNIKQNVNVTIRVEDLNDNPPLIDFPNGRNNTVEISNQVPIGYVVTRVRAHDLDAELNGHLTYSIANGNSDNLFDIDPITGAVSVEKSLENIQHKLTKLVIRVRDNGSPEKNSIADLNININQSLAFAIAHSGPLLEGSNFMILIGAIAGALFLLVMIILAVLIVRHRRRQENKRHKYNCRIQEANKAVANGVVSNGDMDKEKEATLKRDKEKKILDTEPSKTLKKEVTFNFEHNEDTYMDKMAPAWTSLQDDPDMQIKPPPPQPVRPISPDRREPPPKPERSQDTQVTTRDPRLMKGIPKPPFAYQHRGKPVHHHTGPHFSTRSSPHHQINYHPGNGAPGEKNLRLTQVDLEMHDMLNLSGHTDRDSESGCSGSYTDSGRGPSEEGDNCMYNHHQLDPLYGERKTYTEIFTTDSSGHNDSTSSQGSSQPSVPPKTSTPISVLNPGGPGSRAPLAPQTLDVTQLPGMRVNGRSNGQHQRPMSAHQSTNFSTFRGDNQSLGAPALPPRSDSVYGHSTLPHHSHNNNMDRDHFAAQNNLNKSMPNVAEQQYNPGYSASTVGQGKWNVGGETGANTLKKKEVRFAEDCMDMKKREDDNYTDYTSSMDGLSDSGTTTSGSYMVDGGYSDYGDSRTVRLDVPREVSV